MLELTCDMQGIKRLFFLQRMLLLKEWILLNNAKLRIYIHYICIVYQTQTIPGIGIEVLVFWPVLVLVLVLKIPNFQVLVLVLVLKNWFCRYWYWDWYWLQRAFIPKAAEDTQKGPVNTICFKQTIQKCYKRSYVRLYGWFKAAFYMICSKIQPQYWYWYWGIGVLPSIGIGFGIENFI